MKIEVRDTGLCTCKESAHPMSLEAEQYQFCFRKQNCPRAQRIGQFSMPNLKICHAEMTISLRKEIQTLPTAALETSRGASCFDRPKP
jgi:hypothetical protein